MDELDDEEEDEYEEDEREATTAVKMIITMRVKKIYQWLGMKMKNLSDVRQRQKAGVSKKEGSDAGEDECDDHHD